MNSLLISVALLLFVTGGNALQCYNCTYHDFQPATSSCAPNQVSANHLVTCPPDKPVCSAVSARGTVLGQKIYTVVRGCSPRIAEICLVILGLNTCTSECSTDGCNTGSDAFVVKPPVTVVMVAASLLAYLFSSKITN
ncbi:uncharacterized protein LOC100179119 [Ciona intestinalis]